MAGRKKAKKGVRSSGRNLSSRLDRIEKAQEKILVFQKKILARETDLKKEEDFLVGLEKREIDKEEKIDEEERQELSELKKLEALQQKIQQEVKENPLKKITKRDIVKGIIGAFFGIVGHFAFAKGVELAEHYTYLRSSLLFATSFVIIVLFLYFAGFRKVDDHFILKVLPLRAIVIYCSAIITVLVVLLLYGKIGFDTEFHVIFNTVAAISLLAVLGAGTADLIGKTED